MDKEVPIADIPKKCEDESPSEVEKLGEELLALIFDKIDDPDDRKSLSLVCRQWFRVEGVNRSTLHALEPIRFPNFLPRFPNLLKFRASVGIPNSLIEFLVNTCPRIEVLNLSCHREREGILLENVGDDDFDDEGLCCIAKGLPSLETVSLRGRKRIENIGVASLGDYSKRLRFLDLKMCSKVSDEALETIGELHNLEVLNLHGCCSITDWGLRYLSDGYTCNTLKYLNLAECDLITDRGVAYLNQMLLEELSLADCGPKVTDYGIERGLAVMMTLKKLDLSWLVSVSNEALIALSTCCWGLEVLILTGCEMITAVGIRALAGYKSLRELEFTCRDCDVCGDDLEELVFGCPSLEYIALDKRLKMWIAESVQEKILKRNCRIDWI